MEKDFFIIEGKMLDENQIKSIINDEINNLVIASAGSGKTTTIVGKVKYLLNIKSYKKEELLVLSFTNNSAKEMKERIKKETNEEIDVMTFHKLGLTIIQTYSNNKPNLLTNDISEVLLIMIKKLILNEEYMKKVITFVYKPKNKKVIDALYLESKYNYLILYDLLPLFSSFLTLVKQKNLTSDQLYISNNKHYKQFLTIFLPLFDEYQSYLKDNNFLDFNDMINQSITIIKNSLLHLPYSYIIVDEYQDISKSRFELIKAIKDMNNSKLFCVGDDFQCIFSFAGSELDYFVNFDKYFGYYNKTIIDKTYRFNQSLANIAGNFVMKNKKQFKKHTTSMIKDNSFGISIIIANSNNDLLNKLIIILQNLPNFSTIFLLGRYKKDIEFIKQSAAFFTKKKKYLEIIYEKRIDLDINFLTIHESKGLQADYIFILNNKNATLGFPSKIVDTKILNIIKENKETYPYSEERRLFYVAITRAKKKTFLLGINKEESIFLKELQRKYKTKLKKNS